MHIADVTMFYTPVSGGVRTYLEAKQRGLAGRARHSLVVPGSRRSHDAAFHNVPAPWLPFSKGYRFPLRKRSWVEMLVELRPDLIEAGDPYVPAWACVEAGQRLGVPVVGYYHSDLPRLVNSRLGEWTSPFLENYVCSLYNQFDCVLAPSKVMIDKLLRLGVQRVRLQPLGVDTLQFHPRHRDARLKQSLGIADEVRLLIFVGRAAREKNIPTLLKAMEILGKKFHLLLIGPGMPRRAPFNVSVIHGYLPAAPVARYLASSDALIHAGDKETFGLVVLEAMASGIPVIGTREGAVAELVAPACGLLAEAPNAASLAEAVRLLFAGEPNEMGRLARRRVEEFYSWDRILEQMLRQYAALIEPGSQTHEGTRHV